MKSIKLCIVILCSTLLLASCNTQYNTSLYDDVYYMNGVNSKSVEVNEGETINVTVELSVRKGEMYVDISDGYDNVIYTTDVSNTFEFTAEHDTILIANVNATKASGRYKVTFEKQ